ncbi:hypothetical protein AVEN_116558-1 [Araneus ventricosus]|uniref:Uncharacterized protein n=1 Tax=Araneus ventricosus TaxID=182803 RepID=A0A4Y2S1X1_ARAVE|nr:hypothetical protein AVEN_116558-1 [Araneus ventricosus]
MLRTFAVSSPARNCLFFDLLYKWDEESRSSARKEFSPTSGPIKLIAFIFFTLPEERGGGEMSRWSCVFFFLSALLAAFLLFFCRGGGRCVGLCVDNEGSESVLMWCSEERESEAQGSYGWEVVFAFG